MSTGQGSSDVMAGALAGRVGPVRVLLVEDHAETLRGLQRLLAKEGYVVYAAGTVADAVGLAEKHAFDVLVTGMRLPDGNGEQLLAELRARRPVRAVAVTGYGMHEDVERSRRAGFACHLTKPISFARLHATLTAVADGGAPPEEC